MRRFVQMLGAGLVLAGLCLSLWWGLLAQGQEAAMAAWFADRRGDGWQAEHGEISVAGFPLRLDRRIEAIALADPEAGWSWQLPEVAVSGHALAPTEIAIALPAQHRLAVPGERVEIAHEALTASLALAPGGALTLREAMLRGRKLRLSAQSGWVADAVSLQADIVQRPPEAGPENSYNLRIEAVEMAIPKPVLAAIDPTGLLEAVVNRALFEGHAAFSDPLDRFALEDGRLALAQASIRVARLDWGEVAVEARGSFLVDPAGYPEGKIKLKLRNWRRMLAVARESERVPGEVVDAVEQALGFVALLAGGDAELDVPLDMAGGKLRIGPVTVADLPRVGLERR
ncbi:MAG: DUF2125 domain-containing protein [Pseudomonadota bacterium]